LKNDIIYYSIGALLYCPANKKDIADSIISEKFGTKFSLAPCLEDTINDNFVEEAEIILISSLKQIHNNTQEKSFYLPKIFIRVRNHEQITRLTGLLGKAADIVTGFIIPKFSTDNADDYINAVIKANEIADKPMYMMPIYENSCIINPKNRTDILCRLKDSLSKVEDRVLNIRVGGNDLCNAFGFRRHNDESIHKIRPVSNIFADIITVYGMDYVVSGPVWEYYSGDGWDTGLRQEIRDDRLCGFTGKTVIHPNQIAIVNDEYKVSVKDYDDAKAILGWDKSLNSLVLGSQSGERMNEYKTHGSWAVQTLFLAEAFGVK